MAVKFEFESLHIAECLGAVYFILIHKLGHDDGWRRVECGWRVTVTVDLGDCGRRVRLGRVPDGGGGLSLPPPGVDGVPPGLVPLDGLLPCLFGATGGGS